MALLREGRGREAKEFFQRAVDISPEMALQVIKAARDRNVDCIVAPYEADAELAFLSLAGLADVVVTEDSDLTLFGCPKVIFKLLDTGDGILYERDNLPKVFGLQADSFSFDKFRYMCITAGCDYLSNLPGVGLGKSKNCWHKVTNPDLRSVLRKLPTYLKMPGLIVTQDYIEKFIKADNTFLYQLVYDPQTRKERPLTPYPESLRGSTDQLTYCGTYSETGLATQMALGNINIFSKKQVDNYDPDTRQVAQGSTKYGERAKHASVWRGDYWDQKKSGNINKSESAEQVSAFFTNSKSVSSKTEAREVPRSRGVEKRKSEVTEDQVESLLDDLEEQEEPREITQRSPPRKKTKLSEISKLKKVVGIGESKSLKVSKYFGSKKNQEGGSEENVIKTEVTEEPVRGRRQPGGEVGSWFDKIEQSTSAEGKFIYSTEKETVLREISNSLEDTPEILYRTQQRNPFAVKLQGRRLSGDLAAPELQSAGPEGSEEVQVVSSSQLSLYSIDGDSLTFSQSPCSTQPLAGSSPETDEPLASQSSQPPPASRAAPRLGLSRTSGSRGSTASSRPAAPVRKTSSAGPRLGLSRGGGAVGRKQKTLMEMFGKVETSRAQLGSNK